MAVASWVLYRVLYLCKESDGVIDGCSCVTYFAIDIGGARALGEFHGMRAWVLIG